MKNTFSITYKILIISVLSSNISLAQKDSTMEAIVIREQVNPFNTLSSSVDLKVSETLKYPGVFFDPARLAMAKAGVVNDNDQANGLSIRGNSPDALQWRLEGVEILNPNHLSNAANWNNSPAAASGGVNMLSTQMLGTSSLLMGGYAAEYGNVQSGVMDMRLRAGATDRHRFVAQIGLVGIDLAAEGPLSKNKRLTYSSNYRYSTVGLLSKLGVDFGDEKTAFQDLGVHLNYVGKQHWGAKAFYIKGNSNNTYRADLLNDSLVSIRQLSRLSFRQNNQIIGFSANGKVGENGNWKLSSVLSGSSLHNQRIDNQSYPLNFGNRDTIQQNLNLWSSMLSFSEEKKEFAYKIGMFLDDRFSEEKLNFNYAGGSNGRDIKAYLVNKSLLRYGVFLDAIHHLGNKWKLQYGVQADRYDYDYTFTQLTTGKDKSESKNYPFILHPRLSMSYQHNSANIFIYTTSYSRRATFSDYYTAEKIPSMNNTSLSWKHHFSNYSQFTIDAFYQLNKMNYQYLYLTNSNRIVSQDADNHGIAIRFEKKFNNESFLNVNATWFRSTFQNEDKKWYATKYDGRFSSNLVFGKQWQRKENRTLGINCNLIFNGGQRDTPIDVLKSSSSFPYETAYESSSFYSLQLKHYFRSDLRVYRTIKKKHYTATLSLDIQNITNQQNVSFQYYDAIQKGIVSRYQTGLVPILNYRVEF